jgi:hypothetical protein
MARTDLATVPIALQCGASGTFRIQPAFLNTNHVLRRCLANFPTIAAQGLETPRHTSLFLHCEPGGAL